MAMDIVFNELSLSQPAPTIEIARSWMSQFIETIASLLKRGIDVFRILPSFHTSILAADYPLARWRNDEGVDIEQRRLLRRLQTKSQDLDPNLDQDAFIRWQNCEVCHQGQPAPGLATAFVLSGIAVSIASDNYWNSSIIAVDLKTLSKEAEIVVENASVVHASCVEHVGVHDEWIADRLKIVFVDGADIWRKRTSAFEHLIFCERVEGQLNSMASGNPWFGPALKRLTELNEYCKTWSDGGFDPETLHHATPESGQTLVAFANQHTFDCPDGERRIFSWHLRWTPNSGRVYFYPLNAEKKIVIGHLGAHLPTVLYP
jgi:hypothetical protein